MGPEHLTVSEEQPVENDSGFREVEDVDIEEGLGTAAETAAPEATVEEGEFLDKLNAELAAATTEIEAATTPEAIMAIETKVTESFYELALKRGEQIMMGYTVLYKTLLGINYFGRLRQLLGSHRVSNLEEYRQMKEDNRAAGAIAKLDELLLGAVAAGVERGLIPITKEVVNAAATASYTTARILISPLEQFTDGLIRSHHAQQQAAAARRAELSLLRGISRVDSSPNEAGPRSISTEPASEEAIS